MFASSSPGPTGNATLSDGEWGGVPGRSEVKFRKGLAIVSIWRFGFGLILPRNSITTELNYIRFFFILPLHFIPVLRVRVDFDIDHSGTYSRARVSHSKRYQKHGAAKMNTKARHCKSILPLPTFTFYTSTTRWKGY